ncbi:putative glycosyl hydrolase [Corynebacterium provencense]|uniref:Putative glycosyl hydrolase n=2 Tax=Corynebacterium provencense TaxID=1737425 RepID=A0A2Z3YMT3_9CORY|nr:putative glycosyl hydrolase [Corynebacterium provencense]
MTGGVGGCRGGSRGGATGGTHRHRAGPAVARRVRRASGRVWPYDGGMTDRTRTDRSPLPDLAAYAAVLFDLDGVITPTADLHRQAWSEVFTRYFADRGVPPYTEQDYFDFLDGRPRTEGVAALLASRGISLPVDRGDPRWAAAGGGPGEDTPQDATVTGLGLLKNDRFLGLLGEGISAYPGSVALLDALAGTGTRLAVVSSSRNAVPVLRSAGLLDRFEVVVDGVRAGREGLPGKPAPDTYSYGASLLDTDNSRAVVVEDATSGVAAGAAGGFGLVLGVDRGAGARALLEAGADVVVTDLDELVGRVGTLNVDPSEGNIDD